MLVSRLWLRGLTRRSSQKRRFLSHENTAYSVSSSHRDGFFAGRNLGFGRTRLHDELHGFLLSTPLLREGFFAERERRIIPVCACLCSADKRRYFCTSEDRIVEGNVGFLVLQQDNGIPTWEEQIKPYFKNCADSERDIPLLHEHFASVRKHASAEGWNDSDLHCIGATADGIDDPSFPHKNNMVARVTRTRSTSRTHIREDRKWEATASLGDKDAQNPSAFQSETVMGECRSFERLEDSDNGDGGVNAGLGLTKDINVFTPQDSTISKAICELLNSKGWTESTKEILEKQYSAHFPPAVISTVILQQKNVALATSLFQWACEHMGHNSHIYYTYLVRLAETKHFDEMWDLLTKMKENGLEVNGRTFCMMIRACGVAGVPAMAVFAFKRAHEYGIVSDIRLHRALLAMFFECNLVEEARLFYSFMVQEGLVFDTYMFNTLIDGFNLFSATEDAKRSFDTMLKEGCEPHILTYNGLIEAYCNVNAIEKAMSVFSDLLRRGLKPIASTVNVLLSAFFKMGRLDDAISLFVSMSTFCTPNRSTFNIILHGLFLAKQLSKAITFFSLMEESGLANRMTYIYLLNGLRGSKQTEKVWQLLQNLFAKHGYGIKEVCVALLYNLCCTGKLNEAESLFKGMLESSQEPYVPTFSIMISLYCRLEMLDRAFELLSQLKERGQRPSVFCYTPIIAALLKMNRIVDALKCFQEMLEQKYEVSAFTCDFLLRELCKHGMVEDALHVLNTILSEKICICKPTFTELMKCLCKVGKIEEANSCFRDLYKLRCLPLTKEAALQALSVMDVMSCSSNEKVRISTCVSL